MSDGGSFVHLNAVQGPSETLQMRSPRAYSPQSLTDGEFHRAPSTPYPYMNTPPEDDEMDGDCEMAVEGEEESESRRNPSPCSIGDDVEGCLVQRVTPTNVFQGHGFLDMLPRAVVAPERHYDVLSINVCAMNIDEEEMPPMESAPLLIPRNLAPPPPFKRLYASPFDVPPLPDPSKVALPEMPSSSSSMQSSSSSFDDDMSDGVPRSKRVRFSHNLEHAMYPNGSVVSPESSSRPRKIPVGRDDWKRLVQPGAPMHLKMMFPNHEALIVHVTDTTPVKALFVAAAARGISGPDASFVSAYPRKVESMGGEEDEADHGMETGMRIHQHMSEWPIGSLEICSNSTIHADCY